MKKVLVGGCFDILHPGHLIFLEKAKKEGDFLIVLLESDQKVKQLKGDRRPVNTQKSRAEALKKLDSVDQVVLLPFMEKAEDYDLLIQKMKPDVIAATVRDPNVPYLKRTAKLVSAQLVFVTKRVGGYSSSKLIV